MIKLTKNGFLATAITAIMAIALVFNACKKEDDNNSGSKGFNAKPQSTIVWNGEVDRAVAADILAVPSTRTNASGPKITSNAHSADFPGIYFIWDKKQKDQGYLKVAAEVFDVYEGFTLTSKESNTYWDFNIQVQAGQQMTADNCYVFFIPKVYDNKNINMVFVGGWLDREVPGYDGDIELFGYGCASKYVIISGTVAGGNSVVVDRANNWYLSGQLIKNLWSNTISGAYPQRWAEMMNITTDNGRSAQWVWDREDSWAYGISGSNLVTYACKFYLAADIEIMEEELPGFEIPFYFACDNAAVVFVNGVKVAQTDVALEGRPEITNEFIGFTDFSDAAFDGEKWQHIYEVDIYPYLRKGQENRITIVAANSDENDGRWNLSNNPAGLIYACEFWTFDPTCEQ